MIPILVIVTALLISSVSVLTPHALAQTSPHTASTNMTSGNTTSTDSNNTNATMTATAELGNKKTFYVFSEEMEAVNETKLGIPGDVYSPSVLVVNEGDTVTMHFYNLDPSDRHTFTMSAPYNINRDAGPLENATITFEASDPGMYRFYRFYCIYHQPTMSG
jgi:plastocyanin